VNSLDKWLECEKCHNSTRLLLGKDSTGHPIIAPCQPCMREERETQAGNAVFSGLCDECGTRTELIKVDGVMTCPSCQTQYRNLD